MLKLILTVMRMNNMIKNKICFLLIFIFGLSSFCYSLFAQYYQKIEPCPLCMVQRWTLFLITIFSLIFMLHNPKHFLIKIYSLIIIGLSAFGIKIAYNHLYLISLPEAQQPQSCGMPLDILFHKLPFLNFISYILKGDAECSKINWKIFGIIAPQAFIILCAFFILLMLFVLFNKRKNKYSY